MKGLITQQTDPVDQLLVYNNVDKVKADGVELELEGKWRNGLESVVSYTLQNSRNAETDLRLTNSPTHVAHVNVIAPLGRARPLRGRRARLPELTANARRQAASAPRPWRI